MNHNLEAEQQVLGAILSNNEALNHCEGLLEHHFYNPLHRQIFGSIGQLLSTGHSVTPVTLRNTFDTQYLANLISGAASFVNVARYSEIIIDLSRCRSIKEICLHGSTLEGSSEEMLADVEASLFSLSEGGKSDSEHVSKPADEVILRAERAYKHSGEINGISTGLRELDRALGGLQDSDLIIVAGSTSMGKTALAVNMAQSAAKDGKSVGIFSLEMSKVQLTQRMISAGCNIPTGAIQGGRFNQAQFQSLLDAKQELSGLPIHIDDTPALSIQILRSRARRMKRRGMDLMVVDYLQLMRGQPTGNRVQEIAEITRGLKAIAKELNIPVIALSQLSRKVDDRDDKRPQLSDLRESGSIEQDADIVMLVYREEYYLERKKPQEGTAKYVDWLVKYEEAKGRAEVMIAKHRNGATDNVSLGFKGITTQFTNL